MPLRCRGRSGDACCFGPSCGIIKKTWTLRLRHDAPTNSGALRGGGQALRNHPQLESVLGTEPLRFVARLMEANLEE